MRDCSTMRNACRRKVSTAIAPGQHEDDGPEPDHPPWSLHYSRWAPSVPNVTRSDLAIVTRTCHDRSMNPTNSSTPINAHHCSARGGDDLPCRSFDGGDTCDDCGNPIPGEKVITHTTIIRRLSAAMGEGPSSWDPDIRGARETFRLISQACGGGRNPYLLTDQTGSAKLAHNATQSVWAQTIMYLSPADASGVANVCPFATPECTDACLGITAGRMPMPNVQAAQRARTTLMVDYPAAFLTILLDEVRRHARRIHADGALFALRLNGTSDIRWELVDGLIDALADCGVDQLIDYTKWPIDRRRSSVADLAIPYHLAPSATEHTAIVDIRPGHVVIVDTAPNDPLPATWAGFVVTDGDHAHGDLRHLDDPTTVTLLRAKGSLRGRVGAPDGFVKPTVVG